MRGDPSVPVGGMDQRRTELDRALGDESTPRYVAVRALIALSGENNERLARATAMGREFVGAVRRRVAEGRAASLLAEKPSAVERVLDAATAQLVAAGRMELGIGGVAAAAGIPRRTLYRLYGADELIDACQRRATALWRARFQRRVERAEASDAERLFLVVDAIADWVGSERFHDDQMLRPLLSADARGDELREHITAIARFATGIAQRAQIAEPHGFGIFVATSVIGAAAWIDRRDEAHAAAIAVVERMSGAPRPGG
jgi:AcrR family transcriptional regulator